MEKRGYLRWAHFILFCYFILYYFILFPRLLTPRNAVEHGNHRRHSKKQAKEDKRKFKENPKNSTKIYLRRKPFLKFSDKKTMVLCLKGLLKASELLSTQRLAWKSLKRVGALVLSSFDSAKRLTLLPIPCIISLPSPALFALHVSEAIGCKRI